MSVTRRSFVRALGFTGASIAAAPLVGARGREALAAELRRGASGEAAEAALAKPGVIRISSNENPRGPGAAALRGIQDALGEASRYPFAPPETLRAAIAAEHGVKPEQVLLGCGSTEVLRMAVDACTSPTRGLVTAAPTFEDPADRATTLGVPVVAVPVDSALRLDLAAMAAAATRGGGAGAGLVFLNNPNNPTATVHGRSAIEDFVHRVLRASPETTILIDEAYHEYVEDPAYATALPLALASPRVIVSRTFSKVYGLAGLRIGYGIAYPDTVALLARHQLGMGINVLAASAATAALTDRTLPARERQLNHEAREYTRRWFESAGFRVAPSQANFLMADIRRDTRQFQEACRAHDVLVGRPFPPLTTHARVSIGTMDEMRAATEVFGRVLG